jgi:uncharacterized lipoprotein
MKIYFSVFFISLFLAACGLSPQIVTIDPELTHAKGKSLSIGSSFNLLVTDTRQSQVLGQRGGVYKDTSIIKTEGDITAKIKQKLTDAFIKSGFTIDPSAATLLDVSIVKLSYQGHGETRIGEIEVSAEILATATNSGAKFTKSYKASRKKEVLKAPDEKKNEAMINEIFSSVVQRVLDDDELLSYLREN